MYAGSREAMEAVQLLTVCLALLVFLAIFRRSSRLDDGRTPPTLPTIEVRDPDAARRMIIDHADSFSNHPAVPFPVDLDAGHHKTTSINSAPYGPLWRMLRCNLTAGIVHPSRLGLLVPVQRDAVEALVADLSAGGAGEVVVRDSLYAAVFRMVARMCFGDGIGERDFGTMQRTLWGFFHSNVDARHLASSRLARLVHWRQWQHLVGTRNRLAEVFVPVIAARRQSRRGNAGGGGIRTYVDSLLDLRIPVTDDKFAGSKGPDTSRPLRDDEMVRLVWEFLGAGTETVVACVEWTLARLVTQPEVQKKLHREVTGDQRNGKGQVSEDRLRELPYLRALILESLRLHPPVPFILRDVGAEAAAVGGATPPPDGTLVRFIFVAEDIGRYGKAWTDPDEFRPERFLAGGEGEDVSTVPGPKEIKMMPFGAGRRHCPGAGLAMIHVGCFVAALVREFEWAPPANGGGVDLMAINALFLKVMKSPLRAYMTPRKSQLSM